MSWPFSVFGQRCRLEAVVKQNAVRRIPSDRITMSQRPTHSQEDAFEMPSSDRQHFFFDIKDGDHLIEDQDGKLLADMDGARAEALALLPDLPRQGMPESGERTFAVRVRDAGGQTIFMAALSLAVQS